MKIYEYKFEDFDETQINSLGSKGWRLRNVLGHQVIMERERERDEDDRDDYLPVSKTISDPLALYRCMEKVKRYDWGNTYEHPEFLTLEDFKNRDFYSDDGEYEAYLSDGFYFIGTNLTSMTDKEYEKFIEENKNKFRDPNNLKIYYIDYPEDK